MDIVYKRDRFYRGTLIATVLFTLMACGLMIWFKTKEAYFDSHGRIAVVAEAALAGQDNFSASNIYKKNFSVQIVDEPESKLKVPLLTQVSGDKITISEEFTQNKLVITLKDGASYMEEGETLMSDSSWMEAVGVYQHEGDIVIEVYCQNPCAYQYTCDNKTVTLSFLPIREQYDKVVVVYTPWENRSSLLTNEWNQAIQKLEEAYHIKIYSTIFVKEEYTDEDMINFANHVHADMVIGMELVEAETKNAVTICNAAYFIPEFGNVELAAIQEQEYAEKTQLEASGFQKCEDKQSWLTKSAVPAALTQLRIPLNQQSAEQTYALNQKMMEALGSIVKQVAETYWLPVEK